MKVKTRVGSLYVVIVEPADLLTNCMSDMRKVKVDLRLFKI